MEVRTGCVGSDEFSSTTDGSLSVGLTDAPVDAASQVVVQFDGLEIKPADGERPTFDFDTPRQIDLLQLQGSDSEALLDGEAVPAGEHNWIRLMVTADRQTPDYFLVLEDGAQHSLFLPSGNQTGLKLVSGFTVPARNERRYQAVLRYGRCGGCRRENSHPMCEPWRARNASSGEPVAVRRG